MLKGLLSSYALQVHRLMQGHGIIELDYRVESCCR